MKDKVQTADRHLNVRFSEEEFAVLEEVRLLMEIRTREMQRPDGIASVSKVTQRAALSESLRSYRAILVELERKRKKQPKN